ELAPMLDLRDELALRGWLLGDPPPNPVPFLEWAEGPPQLQGKRGLLWLGRLSTGMLWSLIILHAGGTIPYPLWALFIPVNLLLWPFVVSPGQRAIARAWAQSRVFAEYAGLFALLSTAEFGAPALRRIQETLRADGLAAHAQMGRLGRLTALSIPRSAMLYT